MEICGQVFANNKMKTLEIEYTVLFNGLLSDLSWPRSLQKSLTTSQTM